MRRGNNRPSRPLDVHRWSDHPESNNFVNRIYSEWFEDYSEAITKKHLKVILLDFYVAWKTHPEMMIGIAMSNSFYKANSRYNALHISSKTIDIVKRLREIGFLDREKGYPGFDGQKGKLSQFWATDELIKEFKRVRFGIHNIRIFDERETVILRDENKKDIPYTDNLETKRMRSLLSDYNHLLSTTFIDIPDLNEPVITIKAKRKKDKDTRIFITQNEKFTRRVFSNGSWEENGRFYGGWWQRIPSEYRSKIYINDEPTVEIDFSGLHPVLVYQDKGIDYWRDIKRDPYQTNIEGLSEEDSREIGKSVLLMSFNLTKEERLFKAVKNELQETIPHYSFTFPNLRKVLNDLRKIHVDIADDMLSGIGLNLMNIDAKIAEYVIIRFTQSDIPVLCIHDSFIVPIRQDGFLRTCMKEAIETILSDFKVNTKQEGLGYHQWQGVRHIDYDFYLSLRDEIANQSVPRSEGYLYRKQQFDEYLKRR